MGILLRHNPALSKGLDYLLHKERMQGGSTGLAGKNYKI
jgi:hypothetical protein